jgi:hypothetical protein
MRLLGLQQEGRDMQENSTQAHRGCRPATVCCLSNPAGPWEAMHGTALCI